MLRLMVKKEAEFKAYIECFVSPELRVGVEEGGVTALTWGVFPNREILLQTTANYLFQMHSLFGQKSILTLEYDVAQFV